jgi:hypothetical protein
MMAVVFCVDTSMVWRVKTAEQKSLVKNDQAAHLHWWARHCHCIVLMIFNEFPHSSQELNHNTQLFFGACGKQSGHVDATSGERQLNVEGQIRHYSDKEILCLWLCAHSAVGPVSRKDLNILQMLSGLPLYLICSVPIILYLCLVKEQTIWAGMNVNSSHSSPKTQFPIKSWFFQPCCPSGT